jgi:thioredoxin reductase
MTANQSVVVGAGPYGLSVAAHLRGAGVPTAVFGKPMEFWQAMPRGMFLRSAWSASSLSAPMRRGNLDSYMVATGARQQLPIPLPTFIDYGKWFQRQHVPDVDPTYVESVDRDGAGFHVGLADGRRVAADRVVLAAGIGTFAFTPDFARDLPESLASHSGAHPDLSRFQGQTVGVIGGGQSAIETSALLHEVGAGVELIVRNQVRWLSFHDYRGPGRKLLYAPSDVGPPGLNWLLHFPLVFRRLPLKTRLAITRRAVKPAGARWLHDRVVGKVRITEHTWVTRADPQHGRLWLELSDGSARLLDHLFLATGYRPGLEKLPFISPSIRAQVAERDGWPVLNRWLESSVPGLHFVGGIADHSYGPICRFVSGAESAARQIAAHATHPRATG